jgi:hypothetical protein
VNNIDNETDMTAIILQLDDLIQKTIDWVDTEDIEEIKKVIEILSPLSTDVILQDTDIIYAKNVNEIKTILGDDKYEEVLQWYFDELENTDNKEKRKAILQKIFSLWQSAKTSWDIDDTMFVLIKTDICNLLEYYQIQSEVCGDIPSNILESNWTSSSSWSILKVIWTILLVMVILFVIIIWIFVIKAKRAREDEEEDDE